MSDSPLFRNFNKLLKEQQEALLRFAAAQQKSRNRGYRSQPDRYAKRTGTGQGNWLWNAILSKLGPLGAVVDAMLRPNGQNMAPDVQSELEAAQKLLESFGFNVSSGGDVVADVVRELVEEKPAEKKPVEAPKTLEDVRPEPQQQDDEPARGTSDAIDRSQGLVEGMIPVRSSNVHSIGFEWPENGGTVGNLLVRFLGGTSKERGGPGPLYRYIGVDRTIFDAFKRAASKGSFVWDELRVRGTVSGHQYAYDFIGTGNSDYIPRQAVVGRRGRAGEAFVKRSFKGRKSQLPDQEIRGGRDLTKSFKGEAAKMAFKRSTRKL